jgi:hypothetical protein
MNLIEAIKSGRRYKRKNWYPTEYRMPYLHNYDLVKEDLLENFLANDWEIETLPEKNVTITKEQLKSEIESAFIWADAAGIFPRFTTLKDAIYSHMVKGLELE